MSYTNPKYTYVSPQPAYDRLQQTVVQATATIADKVEKERLQGEKQWELSQGASQDFITNSLSRNDEGTEVTQGAVTKMFEGSGARVGELTMATRGSNPQCKADGNCDELNKELAALQQGPAEMKGFIMNLSDQLDYASIQNFDRGQNSRAQIMSNILSGDIMNDDNGKDYSYEFVNKGNNEFEMVATYSGAGEDQGFFNPETGEYDKTFSLSSGRLKSMANGNGSIFQDTPQSGNISNSIMQESNLYAGATYDKNGKRQGGEYDLTQFQTMVLDANGDPTGEPELTKYFTGGANKEVAMYASIDKDRIAENPGINNSINEQIANYTGPGGDDGQTRSYWNQVLSKRTKGLDFDAELAKEVFREAEWMSEEISDEELKTKWGETMSKWSYNQPLSYEQKAIFGHIFKEEVVDNIYSDMSAQGNNLRTQEPVTGGSSSSGDKLPKGHLDTK
mgnify:FL=1|tara:strand:- start:76 stop:1425 length:1350 start_codon:yes stop_codon:yes gene_type:complete